MNFKVTNAATGRDGGQQARENQLLRSAEVGSQFLAPHPFLPLAPGFTRVALLVAVVGGMVAALPNKLVW